MTFARIVLAASAMAFFAIGLPALLEPTTIANLAGISFDRPIADFDFRAVYGGLQCGCGVALLCAALSGSRLRDGLLLQQVLFGGLIVGRITSLVLAEPPGALGLALLSAELVGIACAFVARRSLP